MPGIYVFEDMHDSILGQRVPRPADPASLRVAAALSKFRSADKELRRAKNSVPSYTGQWSDEDYYADQQEDYNRAADELGNALRALMGVEEIPEPTGPSPFQQAMSQPISTLGWTDKWLEKATKLGAVYVGDVVNLIDNYKMTGLPYTATKPLRDIPARQGRETWTRP